MLPSPADSTLATWDWIDVQYGDNVYVAIDRNSTRTAYSFDGAYLVCRNGPSPDDSNPTKLEAIEICTRGVFFDW